MTDAHGLRAADLFDVRRCSVLVTGAASGIGFGYAEVMAVNGVHVVLADADGAAMEAAVARLAASGARVAGVVADVTRAATWTECRLDGALASCARGSRRY